MEGGQKRCGSEKPGFDFGKLLLGLSVVLFGLFLLGKNTGHIPQEIDIDIFQLWPILVIAFGLSFLDTRRPFFFFLAFMIFMAVAAVISMVVLDQVRKSLVEGRGQDQSVDIDMSVGMDASDPGIGRS